MRISDWSSDVCSSDLEDGLAETIAAFNGYCETGDDLDFKRGTHPWGALMCGDPQQKPNANLGPLLQAPFYAIPLHRMAGGCIAATGVLADEHCRVVDWNNKTIDRSEEHTSELQSLMRISYAVCCLKQKK